MTFDDGVDTTSQEVTHARITESLIRLLAQIVLSVGIVGVYLIMLAQGNPHATDLQTVVLGVIAFWLGQSVTSAWAGVQFKKMEVQGGKNE